MADDKIITDSQRSTRKHSWANLGNLKRWKSIPGIPGVLTFLSSLLPKGYLRWVWDWLERFHTFKWIIDGIKDHLLPKGFSMPINVWMLLIGLTWLTIVILWPAKKTEATIPATGILPENDRNAGELPALRPHVVPARYDKLPGQPFVRLFIANDGEPAYEISIPQAKIGTSILEIEGELARLTNNDGDTDCKVYIKRENRNTSDGRSLMSEMIDQNIAQVNMAIHYRDRDNRWYKTLFKLERDVTAADVGIRIRDIKQEVENKPAEPTPVDAPKVILEYHWQDRNADGKTDSINMPVRFMNAGKEIAVNVELEIRTNKWIARFDSIPHLRPNEPQDRQANLENIEFNFIPAERSSHQLIQMLQPLYDERFKQSICVPATVKYSDMNGEQFVSEYEFRWNHNKREAVAVFVRYGRPKLDSLGAVG